ncbi:MAG: TonB-dependent receptor, partial [Chitinophagaceae bacterium]|nr:TonB-dependent receptor [Chitinophagaceae bacterium]
MLNKILSSLLLLLFLQQAAFALEDNTAVSGKVVDKKNTPIPYATVTLMRTDSTVVNGAITDDNGVFEITPVQYGTFLLRISGIGVNTVTKKGITITQDNPKFTMGKITVETTSQTLQEVKITDNRPMMEIGIDKRVFNVERNITSSGGSVSDVLQNIPSVSVDVDGSVSLRGKAGVTILIDGKPATLLGGDEASALQSLPASSVDQVEVITNPSARYDATGMTGIINIITKKEKKFGLNGNFRVGVGTQDKYNGGLGLNMKNRKW